MATAINCGASALVLSGRLDSVAPRSSVLSVVLMTGLVFALASVQLSIDVSLRSGAEPAELASTIMTGVSLTVLLFTQATLAGRGLRHAAEVVNPVALGAVKLGLATVLALMAWRTMSRTSSVRRALFAAAAFGLGLVLKATDFVVVSGTILLGLTISSQRTVERAKWVRGAILIITSTTAAWVAALAVSEPAANGILALSMAATACGAQIYMLHSSPVRCTAQATSVEELPR